MHRLENLLVFGKWDEFSCEGAILPTVEESSMTQIICSYLTTMYAQYELPGLSEIILITKISEIPASFPPCVNLVPTTDLQFGSFALNKIKGRNLHNLILIY